MAIHVEAGFLLAQAAIPVLRKSTQARIIIIGSVYDSLGINDDVFGDRLPGITSAVPDPSANSLMLLPKEPFSS